MRRAAKIWLLLAAGAVWMSGCEQTATKALKAHPPAATPAPISVYAQEALPLPEHLTYQPPISAVPRPAIDVLVDEVQACLDAGQKARGAGDAQQARAEYDLAIQMILQSGLQADSDPRLSKLFDQIGDADQSGELSAAMSGEETESEAPAEPAPIDEIADLTLPAGDPRLALMAEKELMTVHHDLPLTVNESVLQYLSFFTTPRGRAIVEHGLERAGRYSVMIRGALAEEGVPQDLIYLAQAESAFQPEAVSRAGARGIWQFMPYRGEEYGLERNYWVDERSNPVKATHAAAQHMRDLYGMFGDWYLVMAAYNSGPLNVAKAIERTGYADFWELQKRDALPRQTQNYVPIIIALAMVAKDPALYGVRVTPEQPTPTETVKLNHAISLRLVADATGADVEDLRQMNPELLRGTTPNDPGFALQVPAGTAKVLKQDIQQVPKDKWTCWRLHMTEEGESLEDVARHYRVTPTALDAANHLAPHAEVEAGFLLNVPMPAEPRMVRYRVRRGDTLAGIADRFDVTVTELKRWNHISGQRVRPGWRLRIYPGDMSADVLPEPSPRSSATPKVRSVAARNSEGSLPVAHRVERGETLYSIARQYQTTVSALRHANPFLAERPLQAGDVLTIQR